MSERKRGILLLSGGIDSPVAGRMVQEQGVDLEGLHCSFEPVTGPESVDKAKDLARLLGLKRLHVARIGDVLSAIPHHRDAHRHYFILQKRLFYRLAGRLAKDTDAAFIVTGENLGQVSSQTLSNLATLEAAAPVPIVRPLLGLDKNDIIRFAREYGTYDTSIGPELCDLLGPNKPATRSDAGKVASLEDEVGMDVRSIPLESIDL